jgi:MFS family permease
MAQGRYLKRWLVIGAIGQLPVGMVFAFSQVYAHEVKGADAVVLGLMTASAALASIVLAVPLGRLADRIGRKRVLYVTIPLFALSCLVLVWAPGPLALIAAGALQSFFYIGRPIGAAMERELIPASHMGRWIGINRVVRMLLSSVLVLAAGIIWDSVGPEYVFLAFVVIDLGLRLPLLASMPETLDIRLTPSAA